jgi:hypothetical protein
MSEEKPATDAARIAVECLTLWLEPGPFARAKAVKHITDIRNASAASADEVIAGLLNLSMMPVIDLAIQRGATQDDALDRAGDILRDWSPRLPDGRGELGDRPRGRRTAV